MDNELLIILGLGVGVFFWAQHRAKKGLEESARQWGYRV